MSEMGTFRITVEIENMFRPGVRERIPAVLVDTGAELSWFPTTILDAIGVERHERRRFRLATGAVVEEEADRRRTCGCRHRLVIPSVARDLHLTCI